MLLGWVEKSGKFRQKRPKMSILASVVNFILPKVYVIEQCSRGRSVTQGRMCLGKNWYYDIRSRHVTRSAQKYKILKLRVFVIFL